MDKKILRINKQLQQGYKMELCMKNLISFLYANNEQNNWKNTMLVISTFPKIEIFRYKPTKIHITTQI